VRTNKVIQHEIDVTRHQLMRNGIEVIAAAFDGINRLGIVEHETAPMTA